MYGNYIDEVLTMHWGGNDYFYHTDDLFNVVALTDANGTVLETYDYDDYGNPTNVSSYSNPYLFNGRRYDDETGLYYYRTRYLDSETGRFTTRDTIGIWGDPNNLGNGYAYVGNNPWTFVDPFGENPESLFMDYMSHSKDTHGYGMSGVVGLWNSFWDWNIFNGSIKKPVSDVAFNFMNPLLNTVEGDYHNQLPPGYLSNNPHASNNFEQLRESTDLFGERVEQRANETCKEIILIPIFGCMKVGNYGDELADGINGAGKYSDLKGHHVHAKKAFEGLENYDVNEAFSISNELLSRYGVTHVKITGIQKRLFKDFAKSGNPNTLTHHTLIALKTLLEAGIPKEDAIKIVNASLKNLIRQGVVEPVNIPWAP